MKSVFDELEESINYYKLIYRNKTKQAILRLMYRCSLTFFKQTAPSLKEKPLNCWMTIKDSTGIDITGNIIKDPKALTIPQIPYESHIFFNLNKVLKENPQIKRFGLVFFMGIGDYFFMTGFLNYFKSSFPDIKFDAYVSNSKDINSSPGVFDCLKVNPIFENVYTFKGKANKDFWKNYDYSACYKNLAKDTLLLPIIYEYNTKVYSRTDSLISTFNLKPLAAIPNIYVPLSYNLSEQGQNLLNLINKKMEEEKLKGIIFLQLEHRSTNYRYPYEKQLIEKLLNDNFLILCPDKPKQEHKNLISIDTKTLSICDSIKILAELKQKYVLRVLGVVSCFMAIASGLKIPALVLQHFADPPLKSYLPKNIYIITHTLYEDIARNFCFIAQKENYTRNTYFFDFHPDFVLECFTKFQKLI